MPRLHENGSMRFEPKLDHIECAFGMMLVNRAISCCDFTTHS